MGVKERKERERMEMKEKIFQSAHDLFLTKGFDEISIRSIAEAIEYSPATIYLYFKDKGEIYCALHDEAFKRFNEFTADVFKISDPIERLFVLGEKYIHFSLLHPQYYEIMFIIKAPMECEVNHDEWKEGCKALEGLEFLVAECIKAGHFKGHDHKVLSFMIWCFMHGMCSLHLCDRMKVYEEDQREIIRIKAFESFKQMILKL